MSAGVRVGGRIFKHPFEALTIVMSYILSCSRGWYVQQRRRGRSRGGTRCGIEIYAPQAMGLFIGFEPLGGPCRATGKEVTCMYGARINLLERSCTFKHNHAARLAHLLILQAEVERVRRLPQQPGLYIPCGRFCNRYIFFFRFFL